MARYAVIRLGGKQYKVKEKDEILVDRIADPQKIEPEVLLFVADGKVKIGKPVLKEIKTKVKVLAETEKGEKIDVYKFKAKSRYRRHTGFCPQYTRLRIESIS